MDARSSRRSLRNVDLVKDPAVSEVFRLRLGPTAEAGNVDQFQRWKAGHILGVGFRAVPAPVEVLERQRLPFGRVKEVQIGLGQRALIFGFELPSTSATGGSARTLTEGTTMSN